MGGIARYVGKYLFCNLVSSNCVVAHGNVPLAKKPFPISSIVRKSRRLSQLAAALCDRPGGIGEHAKRRRMSVVADSVSVGASKSKFQR